MAQILASKGTLIGARVSRTETGTPPYQSSTTTDSWINTALAPSYENDASVEQNPVVPDEFAECGTELRKLYVAIRGLCVQDLDDEGASPTPFALETVFETLEQVGYCLMRLRTPFPKGYAAEDDHGGLRIEWWNGQGSVSLAIGADETIPPYFFAKPRPNQKGVLEKPLDASKLAQALVSLFEA